MKWRIITTGGRCIHRHRHGRSIGLMPALARSPASSSPSTCSSPSGSSSQLKNRHPTGVPSTLIGHHSMPVPTQKHQHQPLWVKKIVSHLDFDASVAPSPLPSSYRKWLTYPIGQCQTIDVFVVVVVAVERFQVSVFFFSSSVLVGSHLPVLPLFIEIHWFRLHAAEFSPPALVVSAPKPFQLEI